MDLQDHFTKFFAISESEEQRFHGLDVLPENNLVAVCGTALVVFVFDRAEKVCSQFGNSVSLPQRQISECVACMLLPGTNVPLFAVGGADRRVHLYVSDHSRIGFIAWLEGHHDWVRDLSFCTEEGTGDLLLASCSTDSYIRMWRIARYTDDMQEQFAQSAIQESEQKQKILFCVRDDENNLPRFFVGLDALLIGHGHWVLSVSWHPKVDGKQPNRLVSASMDKTMIVWEKDEEEEVWVDQRRIGEIGGNSLGFYGASFSPDGSLIMGHSFNGSLHLWSKKGEKYEPLPSISGHTAAVKDIAWDEKGRYFLSASADQTVRLWCLWNDGEQVKGWFELARPHIHGHDLNAITVVPKREHCFASGAEEKTIRVFTATSSFVSSLQNVAQETTNDPKGVVRSFGATLPPLGLSNKPLSGETDAKNAEKTRMEEAFPDEVWKAEPVVFKSPPIETQLAQSTLWVEERKLYGHGSELFALAASHDGKLLASACKGKAKPHTDVILWNVSDWSIACRLSRHKMTVTKICFTKDDSYIVTVSRDLRLCLWKRKNDTTYEMAWELEKAHARIIWDCCFSPDDALLLTCSRDKKISMWALDKEKGALNVMTSVKRSSPLTSVAFHPVFKYVVAVGNDSGNISFWRIDEASLKWSLLKESRVHGNCAVNRMQFKLVPALQSMMLLSCSEDHSVRLTRVRVTDTFAQLCSLLLSVEKAYSISIPQLVIKMISNFLKQ